MSKFLAVLLIATAASLIAACDDGTDDASTYDHWCSEFDRFANEMSQVMSESSTPPDPESEEVRQLNAIGEEFFSLPVPEPIREDFDAALPRSMQRPFPDEQIRARANTYQWVVDNCTLSDEIDSELRQEVADDREYLDGIPPTTA